jgi:hypothetical protein
MSASPSTVGRSRRSSYRQKLADAVLRGGEPALDALVPSPGVRGMRRDAAREDEGGDSPSSIRARRAGG